MLNDGFNDGDVQLVTGTFLCEFGVMGNPFTQCENVVTVDNYLGLIYHYGTECVKIYFDAFAGLVHTRTVNPLKLIVTFCSNGRKQVLS